MLQPTQSLVRAHGLNYATTRIDPLANQYPLSHGTGFVVRYRHHYALVTAWHVVTGKNAFTKELMGPIRPESLRFSVTFSDQEELVNYDEQVGLRKQLEISLFDEMGKPTWFELDNRPYQVDVALILLDDFIPEIVHYGGLEHFNTAKRTEHDAYNRGELYPSFEQERLLHLLPRIRSDLHILGFPQKIELSDGFPIWKRASLASEPHAAVLWDGTPNRDIVYADGLTKPGMSGAPVIFIGNEDEPMWTRDGHFYNLKFSNHHLVGIYAGRDGSTKEENEFAMARVWKAELLIELFQKALRAKGLERHMVVDWQ